MCVNSPTKEEVVSGHEIGVIREIEAQRIEPASPGTLEQPGCATFLQGKVEAGDFDLGSLPLKSDSGGLNHARKSSPF